MTVQTYYTPNACTWVHAPTWGPDAYVATFPAIAGRACAFLPQIVRIGNADHAWYVPRIFTGKTWSGGAFTRSHRAAMHALADMVESAIADDARESAELLRIWRMSR